ncbi:MAG: DNA glycosylase [Methanocellales archaeon]|nr:DNA glycosylase [Methanocellales archaeon]
MKTYQIPVPTFDLDHTLRCGQVFRWRENKDGWIGIVDNSVIKAKQEGDVLIVESDLATEDIMNYFRLNDDLDDIYKHISKDDVINEAIARYWGMRLIRQEPWECLISYLCSINNRIPQIERMIQNLSMVFGTNLNGFYGFPSPEQLSKATHDQLKKCKLGFRGNWILDVARKVCREELQLEKLKNMDYQSAKRELLKVNGVGDKVADCVLLYSLDKLEAFPVDVHIRKVVQREYLRNERASDTKIREWAERYFGKYAGYAQQYLFYYERPKEM